MVVLGLEQTVVAVKIYNIAMMALYIRPIIAVQTDFFPKKNKLSEPQNGRVKRKFSNNFGQVCVLARQHFYYYFLFLS